MGIGIDIILYNDSTPLGNLANIQAKWWDVAELKDCATPSGQTDVAVTDANGHCKLDLSKVSGLNIGNEGFLALYQLDTNNHENSLVFAGKLTTSDVTGGVEMKYDSGWTRPADWPTMDEPTPGVQKIQALYQVYDIETAANAVAFVVEGAYTVDWGDGSTVENFASGATATHTFDYVNGAYSVITITPQAGNNITSFDANGIPTGFNSAYRYPYLELRINSDFLTTLDVSYLTIMKQCWIGEHALTSMYNMFHYCYSLQSVPLFNTSSVDNMYAMFHSCHSLKSVPLFDTSAVTTMYTMFYYCYSLKSVPLFNTLAVTTMYKMFYDCYSLQSVPLFNTSLVATMYMMFYGCDSLQSVPLFDTSSVTTMKYMFYGCDSLQSVPLFNASALNTDPSTLFHNCYSLREVVLNGFTGYDLNVNDCSLGPDSLDSLYTGLGNGTGVTLTCSANWGYANSDTTKATDKGWTVA